MACTRQVGRVQVLWPPVPSCVLRGHRGLCCSQAQVEEDGFARPGLSSESHFLSNETPSSLPRRHVLTPNPVPVLALTWQ